jgi:N-acetylglucosamine repressor
MMRQLRPGSKQTIRDINRVLILNLIRRRGTLSRVQLGELSSLAQPTVSDIVAELLDENLLIETTAVISDRRGPRPVLLELNPRGAFALGAMLRPDGMNLVVTDLLADVVSRSFHRFPSDAPPAQVLAHVVDGVRDQVDQAHIPWSSVLGFGVGMTGVIDSATGVCRDAYIFGWHNIPVGDTLQSALGIPTLVDNDTRTLTVAERYVGHGQGHENFVLVTVGRGVGMGAVVGGELLRGHDNVGPEFGHITMQIDGPPCPCGKRGCLEAIASDVGILQAARAAGLADAGTTIESLTERALAGETPLHLLFATAGTALGLGVANLINLFGPKLVVLTGEGLRAGALLLEPLRAVLAGCVFGDRMEQTEMVIKPWDPAWEPWARGAACLVLEDMLRPNLYQPV